MARINVEDSLFSDMRFYNLVFKLGDVDRALGSLVRAWVLGQKWYLSPNKMIPIPEWKKQCLSDFIIETGWAEIVDNEFIRICGADKQFAWLAQKVDAGRKGGITRRGIKLPDQEAARRHGARFMVNKAVKSGKLIKPNFCEDCGVEAEVQGHHFDYSKPLEVSWLCDKCHDTIHKNIEENIKHTLTDDSGTGAYAKPSSLSLSLTQKNKEYSQLEEKSTKGETIAATPLVNSDRVHPLVDLWNKNCGSLPKVKALSSGRLRHTASRWRENPNAEYWSEVISRLVASPFCSGKNDRGWVATYDFLIKPDTATRVLEGAYGTGEVKKKAIMTNLDEIRKIGE